SLRNQRGDAKSGTGPYDQSWLIGLRHTFANGPAFAFVQSRHAERHCVEIVDQQQIAQPKLLAECLTTETPLIIGEAEPVTGNRPGPRQANCLQGICRLPDLLQISPARGCRLRVTDGRQYAHFFDSLVPPQGEAGIGSADVPNQSQFHLSASSSAENTLAP